MAVSPTHALPARRSSRRLRFSRLLRHSRARTRPGQPPRPVQPSCTSRTSRTSLWQPRSWAAGCRHCLARWARRSRPRCSRWARRQRTWRRGPPHCRPRRRSRARNCWRASRWPMWRMSCWSRCRSRWCRSPAQRARRVAGQPAARKAAWWTACSGRRRSGERSDSRSRWALHTVTDRCIPLHTVTYRCIPRA